MKEEDLISTFGSSNLYDILGVEKTCSISILKKSYHKKSLELHPDRQTEEKDSFTLKFQLLHQVYTLLSDKDRRIEYDQFGTIENEANFIDRSSSEWASYWRELFNKVTVDEIVSFEKEYKGSSEEQTDIKTYYNSSKGNMDTIMESIMLVTFEEEDRIRDIINIFIERKEVKCYRNYSNEDPKKRKRREKLGKREAKEAEKHKNDLGGDDELQKAIALRQEERGKNMQSFFSQLEAKYAQPPKKKKKK